MPTKFKFRKVSEKEATYPRRWSRQKFPLLRTYEVTLKETGEVIGTVWAVQTSSHRMAGRLRIPTGHPIRWKWCGPGESQFGLGQSRRTADTRTRAAEGLVKLRNP